MRGPVIGRDGAVTQDLGGWWLGERITGADVDLAVDHVAAVEAAGRRVEVMITHDAPVWVNLHPSGPHWPLGIEQRRLLTEAVDRARPDVLVCGHHHRHTVAPGPHGGVGVALSADVNPNDQQWILIDTPDDAGVPVAVLRFPDWTYRDALPHRRGTGRHARTSPLQRVWP